MLAMIAGGIVIAVLLRAAGDLVRGLILAGIRVLPALPIIVAWALLVELMRRCGLVEAGGEALALIFSAGIVFGAALAAFVRLRRRQVPARLALAGLGLAFGLADLVLVFVVNAVN